MRVFLSSFAPDLQPPTFCCLRLWLFQCTEPDICILTRLFLDQLSICSETLSFLSHSVYIYRDGINTSKLHGHFYHSSSQEKCHYYLGRVSSIKCCNMNVSNAWTPQPVISTFLVGHSCKVLFGFGSSYPQGHCHLTEYKIVLWG